MILKHFLILILNSLLENRAECQWVYWGPNCPCMNECKPLEEILLSTGHAPSLRLSSYHSFLQGKIWKKLKLLKWNILGKHFPQVSYYRFWQSNKLPDIYLISPLEGSWLTLIGDINALYLGRLMEANTNISLILLSQWNNNGRLLKKLEFLFYKSRIVLKDLSERQTTSISRKLFPKVFKKELSSASWQHTIVFRSPQWLHNSSSLVFLVHWRPTYIISNRIGKTCTGKHSCS